MIGYKMRVRTLNLIMRVENAIKNHSKIRPYVPTELDSFSPEMAQALLAADLCIQSFEKIIIDNGIEMDDDTRFAIMSYKRILDEN